MKQQLNIKDHGVSGNGRHPETAAIQSVINQAAVSNAAVYFPAGNYLTGGLILPSDTEIILSKDARIIGSGNIDDYQSYAPVSPDYPSFYLFSAFNASHISITGQGEVTGNGRMFFEDHYLSSKKPFDDPMAFPTIDHYDVLKPKRKRPRMFYFDTCTDIKIDGIKITDSPLYTIWTLGCDKVELSNLQIRNPRNSPNSDALDIDCSTNVHIHHCDIDAGDDCIAVKSDVCRAKNPTLTSQNILAEHCRLSSSTCGIRLGYEGDGLIANCVFRNLTITNTRHPIDLLSTAPGDMGFTRINRGTPIHHIVFEHITMDEVYSPIFIWSGDLQENTDDLPTIEDITLSDIEAHNVHSSSYIGAMSPKTIKDLKLEQINLNLIRPLPSELNLPTVWGNGQLPAALFLKNVSNCTLQHVNIKGVDNTSEKIIFN